MLRHLARSVWAGPIRHIMGSRRLHLTRSDAASVTAIEMGVPLSVERDHGVLQELLDTSPRASAARTAGAPTGLFQIGHLRTPQDFLFLAQRTLVRCQLLVNRISRAHTSRETALVVQNLDRLSDMLCGVIDMAELVRHAHPDEVWATAANEAYEFLCNYMNVLNTHTELYDALRRVMDDPHLYQQLSKEAQAVALIFLRDFEKSGIHLPPRERERFVELSDQIMVLGRAFLQDMSTGTSDAVTEFPTELLAGLDLSLFGQSMLRLRPAKTISVVPGSWELHYISKHAPNPEARRLAYTMSYTGRNKPVAILEQLLHTRYELARLTGKESAAEMALVDKMAGTSEHVSSFLRLMANAQRPAAQKMIAEFGALKHKLEGTSHMDIWDRDFYAEAYLQLHQPSHLTPLSPYLSLGSVFTGLSRLFYLLYGIHFRAAETQPGEVWHPDVLKLEVVDETEDSVIGTIYCDLYSREGKPPSAAHYTVRCSRRIDLDDTHLDLELGASPDLPSVTDTDHLLGVEGAASRGRPGRFQLPVVVLMTDFALPSMGHGGASLLRWHDVETLFHEMGHAIHSMIGRTEFHNVSGTRCATDFVELPSILMEHFLIHPQVVQLTAHHNRTGSPLPYHQLQKHLDTQKRLDALDAHQQILLATLDQRYHSSRAGLPTFSTSEELEALQAEMGLFPPVPNVTWQGQFGHLFGYGATYYSYLFDRAIAARVWDKVFAQQPLSREAGEWFKNEVLRHGGGKNPWHMLARLLKEDDIAHGDSHAMEMIGRWGLGRPVSYVLS